jgi:hypothetical protein
MSRRRSTSRRCVRVSLGRHPKCCMSQGCTCQTSRMLARSCESVHFALTAGLDPQRRSKHPNSRTMTGRIGVNVGARTTNGLRARAEAAPTWNKPDFRRSVAGSLSVTSQRRPRVAADHRLPSPNGTEVAVDGSNRWSTACRGPVVRGVSQRASGRLSAETGV